MQLLNLDQNVQKSGKASSPSQGWARDVKARDRDETETLTSRDRDETFLALKT